MRGLMTPALTAILLIGTLGGIREAQAVSRGSHHQLLASAGIDANALKASPMGVGFAIASPQWGVPGGDYQQTCRDIRTNGNLLQARCQKRDGGWRTTSLDTRSCRSQVINDDGYLRCTQGGGGRPGYGRPPYGGGGWGGGIPPGDYRQTCNNIRVSGQRLDASCQKADGSWRNTSLNNFQRCGDLISNVDGHLRCGR